MGGGGAYPNAPLLMGLTTSKSANEGAAASVGAASASAESGAGARGGNGDGAPGASEAAASRVVNGDRSPLTAGTAANKEADKVAVCRGVTAVAPLPGGRERARRADAVHGAVCAPGHQQ